MSPTIQRRAVCGGSCERRPPVSLQKAAMPSGSPTTRARMSTLSRFGRSSIPSICTSQALAHLSTRARASRRRPLVTLKRTSSTCARAGSVTGFPFIGGNRTKRVSANIPSARLRDAGKPTSALPGLAHPLRLYGSFGKVADGGAQARVAPRARIDSLLSAAQRSAALIGATSRRTDQSGSLRLAAASGRSGSAHRSGADRSWVTGPRPGPRRPEQGSRLHRGFVGR